MSRSSDLATIEQIDGRAFCAARHLTGLTQHQLAARAGLDPSTVSGVEREAARALLDSRRRIALALKRLGVRVTPMGARRDPSLIIGELW